MLNVILKGCRMKQTKNTGVSIIGFLQTLRHNADPDVQPSAKICAIDKGQSSKDIRKVMCNTKNIYQLNRQE